MALIRANLNGEPFRRMKAGEKKMEFRLRKDKWKELKAGDEIEFTEVGSHRTLIVAVLAVVNYVTFVELLQDFDPLLWTSKSMEDQLTGLRKHYSAQQEQDHTVIGIKVKVLSCSE